MEILLKNKWITSTILLVLVATSWLLLFQVRQPDYAVFLLPWLSDIRASDGLTVFSTGFTNYTGGYVAILWLAERIDFFSDGALGDLAVIKIAAIFGSVMCSAGVWSVLRALDWTQVDAFIAAISALLLPEVLLNGAAWAQADALYAAFLTFTIAAMIRAKPYIAVTCFAVAVSIKLQAIWLAPLMAGWLLGRPRMIIPAIIAVPMAYVTVNSLYLIAGRPFREVMLIYFSQFETFERLSMNAPNLWLFADRMLQPDWLTAQFSALVAVGMIAAFVMALWIVWKVYRLPQNAGSQLIYWAAISTISMPFLLPKMHERFFFSAGIFAYLLAVIDRRYVMAAMLIQFAALMSYAQYHDTVGIAALFGRTTSILLAFVCMAAAFAKLLQLRDPRVRSSPNTESSNQL